MVKKEKRSRKHNITADVIILGCSLPGIVTAHKLKKRFGNTMDIVVLDLASTTRKTSQCNVAFQEEIIDDEETEEVHTEPGKPVIDNVALHYLARYARDFNIPLPDAIVAPEKVRSDLSKLFQHRNGSAVECRTDYHDFDYLSFVEKFELDQYQTLLDESMKNLFQMKRENSSSERRRLLYYDQTTMEKHIRTTIFFPTCREIMRTTVRLVCGAPPEQVSVLFYLHQCYRTSTARNHLDGHNTRFREKLLGYCRKRLASKLQKSIADITMSVKTISEIRKSSGEQVILETVIGEDNYVCNLLAMALRPDQLYNIRVETHLLSEGEAKIVSKMIPGRIKKFVVQYEESFWRTLGYSGDILSIRGPIAWAMELPRMSTTGSLEKYATLVGFLKVSDAVSDSKSAVLEQLVNLLGENAANPVSYSETDIPDVFIPRCGDYVALRKLTMEESPKFLEWGAFDVFADGDIAAALEAGHLTYLHLLSCLRPQAQTYEDACSSDWPSLGDLPIKQWLSNINVLSGMRLVTYTTAAIVCFHIVRSYLRK